MKGTIHLETFASRNKVMLHAWDPGGDIRDIEGKSIDCRSFTFELEMEETADPREIQFLFWYPDGESQLWESDAYTRRIPTTDATELWCFEYSRRCMTTDPYAGGMTKNVMVHALSRRRFAGGFVYAWDPSGTSHAEVDLQADTSDPLHWSCSIPLQSWMQKGFHFKLAKRYGERSDFEPDESTRVWRPADGGEVWVKSGQFSVSATRPPLLTATVELTYSRRAPSPVLLVEDDVDDFSAPAVPGSESVLDADFARRSFSFDVYAEAGYRITAEIEQNGSKTIVLSLPFRMRQGDQLTTGRAIAGNYRWLQESPTRDATAKIVVYPNPQSAFGDRILLRWVSGEAPRTTQDRPVPGCHTAVANRRDDGAWETAFAVFSDVPHWIDLLSSPDGMYECRSDGPILSRRSFQIAAGTTVELSTTDGLTGLAIGKVPPTFVDVPDRIAWLKRAFDERIVTAAIFDRWELPLGATVADNEILFTLFAPHAVSAKVLLLETGTDRAGARTCRTFDMQITPDLRYWWCTVSTAYLPDPKRVLYRFQLNGQQEVVDPASRQVSAAPFLFAAPGEGQDGTWSIVSDRQELLAEVDSIPWQTRRWSELLIYEMHPLRFTDRNRNASGPLRPFAQIVEELVPGRYLDALQVTALELLPVHEFPKEISWGYNPALQFAIESSYGGPPGFASLIQRAHAQQKSIILDIVFNHLVESPMQETAPDVFVDGETNWGDMVNYDHPVVQEHFRQAVLHLWDTFRLDGFRLDATLAILQSDKPNGYILRRPGSGGGRDFLVTLHRALHAAADARGQRWPYVVAENDPNDFSIDDGVVDGQWDFTLQYPLGVVACNRDDNTESVKQALIPYRPLYETVRYAESHDAVSAQEAWKQRMVRREAWGFGMSMAKATGAVALLSKGIPMLFMGEEAGEDHPFAFNMRALGAQEAYLDLQHYVDPATPNSHVLHWFNDLMGLRRNTANGLVNDDRPFIGKGRKTVAFTRADGRFFVIATFGTPDTVQNLGGLGLPRDGFYKEIFNSTWAQYAVPKEGPVDNHGYDAALHAWDNVNVPPIGAIVLERR